MTVKYFLQELCYCGH